MSEASYIERYWRDAKPEDAIKEPPMVARFRDYAQVKWSTIFALDGWTRRGTKSAWYGGGVDWFFCQVYDAPEPGDGWRLIDPDNDEPESGDEYKEAWQSKWQPRGELADSPFAPKTYYRRRITPTVTYIPFTWEDREQLRGRWITWKHENGLMIESQIDHINQHRDGGLWFKSHDAKWLLKNAVFVDTSEPVGKKVTQ